MGLIDRLRGKKNNIPNQATITEEQRVLSLKTEQKKYDLLNQATSYMKQRNDIIETHKSAMGKMKQQADEVTKKTVRDWRFSLAAARDIDRPNRYDLFDLFAELRLDPFLDSLVRFQKNKLTHIKRYVNKGDVADEKATKLFNQPWFDQIIAGYVESTLNGFQLLEIDNIIDKNGEFSIDRLNKIPNKNVIPEFQRLKLDAYSDTRTIDYSNNDWIIEIISDDNRNLGILSRLAPYLLWKKLAMGSWSSFTEDFGQPSMIIKSAAKNTDMENELLATMEDIGSSLRMVLDINDEFDMVQADNTDVYQSFKELVREVDDVVSNEIVGGTLLFKNGDGGSYNLSSTHESVSALKTLSDLKEIEKYVNYFLIPKLQKLGLVDEGDINFYFTPEEFLTMGARAEIDAKIMSNGGVRLTKEYLEDTYKFKISEENVETEQPIGLDEPKKEEE